MPEEIPPEPGSHRRRLELRGDCTRCVGLCCVASGFAVSSDFGFDKPAGQPCPNLRPDFGCGIHDQLRERGFPGCVVYDCFGAGQQVVQGTFRGADWRRTPGIAARMYDVFGVMRQLHELLWYLNEALSLPPARPLHDELRVAFDEIERLTHKDPDTLLDLDVDARRQAVSGLLLRASELVRAGVGKRLDKRGADLIGKNFRGADLRGANLRGAYLIGADLRSADLRMADLIGADFRGADIRAADLTDSLFLTQPQLEAAKGDRATTFPPALDRPAHWG